MCVRLLLQGWRSQTHRRVASGTWLAQKAQPFPCQSHVLLCAGGKAQPFPTLSFLLNSGRAQPLPIPGPNRAATKGPTRSSADLVPAATILRRRNLPTGSRSRSAATSTAFLQNGCWNCLLCVCLQTFLFRCLVLPCLRAHTAAGVAAKGSVWDEAILQTAQTSKNATQVYDCEPCWNMFAGVTGAVKNTLVGRSKKGFGDTYLIGGPHASSNETGPQPWVPKVVRDLRCQIVIRIVRFKSLHLIFWTKKRPHL